MFDLIAELLLGLFPELFAERVIERNFHDSLSKIQNQALRVAAGVLVYILAVLTGVMVGMGILFLIGFVVFKLVSLL